MEQKTTKKDVQEFLDTIAKKGTEKDAGNLHTMLALNTILRLPNAVDIFDDRMKGQAREMWTRLKASGLQLNDPPLLFGEAKK